MHPCVGPPDGRVSDGVGPPASGASTTIYANGSDRGGGSPIETTDEHVACSPRYVSGCGKRRQIRSRGLLFTRIAPAHAVVLGCVPVNPFGKKPDDV